MRTLLLLLALFLLGCGDDTTKTDAGSIRDFWSALFNGSTCSSGGECRSKSCTGGKCVQGSGQTGTSCVYDEQCAAGRCMGGTCSVPGAGDGKPPSPDGSVKKDGTGSPDGPPCGKAGAACCPTEPKCDPGYSCSAQNKCVKFA